jgi:hypothetical protein
MQDMINPRYEHTAAQWRDRVYVFFGGETGSAEYFSLTDRTWTAIRSWGNTMSYPGCITVNDKIYIKHHDVAHVIEYDIEKNVYRTLLGDYGRGSVFLYLNDFGFTSISD